jgi:hypothetical protein
MSKGPYPSERVGALPAGRQQLQISENQRLGRQLFAAVHESLVGTERTCRPHWAMSGFGGGAEVPF